MKEKRRADENIDAEVEDEPEIVNVDFDFFDLSDIDFHAVKNLLRQLFDSDNIAFELSPLADQIVSSSAGPGIAVKTDGKESDPYAFVSVVDSSLTQSVPYLQPFAKYFIDKSSDSPHLNRMLRKMFMSNPTDKLGLLFSERLINMPIEVIPPMFKLLCDELPATYTHFLLMSKVFTEQQPQIETPASSSVSLHNSGSRPSKKPKPEFDESQIYYFHPEDELLHKYASYHTYFNYTNPAQTSDSKRAFQDYGIFPKGHLMLFTREKLLEAVQDMLNSLAPGVM